MSTVNRSANGFAVTISVGRIGWGAALLGLGVVVRELALQRYIELGDVESGWSAVAWLSGGIGVVGFVILLVGVISLAGNVDYLAAREAERHRAEARSAD